MCLIDRVSSHISESVSHMSIILHQANSRARHDYSRSCETIYLIYSRVENMYLKCFEAVFRSRVDGFEFGFDDPVLPRIFQRGVEEENNVTAVFCGVRVF